jgi:hypothetical protein
MTKIDGAPLDLSQIEENAESLVRGIGREAVEVFGFLSDEFARGPVVGNHLFQFLYRSFYRLDNAGLTTEFKSRYFLLLEESRNLSEVDLASLVKELYSIPNLKGQQSLQFSFVTKLANTVNRQYPIYDSEVGKVFGFRAPANNKVFEARLNEYLTFYAKLRVAYSEILTKNLLQEPRRIFRQIYAAPPGRISDVKVLDFIFWSAGKLSVVAGALHSSDSPRSNSPRAADTLN